MNRYLAELIGTFLFVLAIGCVVLAAPIGAFAPLAIGSALMAMVYATGHISGGHLNPAVTLAVVMRGKCKAADAAPYIGAQIIGAALAALVVRYLRPEAASAITAMTPDVPRALVAEFLFTFALAYTVLNTATAKGNAGNSFYGLAIGFIVLVGAYAVGDISGGAFNPAVAVGISVLGISAWSNLWIFLVANFAGAAAAALAFRALNPADK